MRKKNHGNSKEIMPEERSTQYFSNPKALQWFTSAMVVLPVIAQAPWVRLYPYSACLFTLVLFGAGICLGEFWKEKFGLIGSLLIGVSGSWLGGCLYWGWLREYPVWHLPVESIVLPFALLGLKTRWRDGASFYLACLLGTGLTDLMMVFTGVMSRWPSVVKAPLKDAPLLLHQAAADLLHPLPISLLLLAGVLIFLLARAMRNQADEEKSLASTWVIASSALFATLGIDGLFLLTASVQPSLSGLI